MLTILLGILEEGLVYAIMALGVYITYKILDFPDLSVDGTFPLGAALTAAGIANGLPFVGKISPIAALFISFFVGALAGCCTGLILSLIHISPSASISPIRGSIGIWRS